MHKILTATLAAGVMAAGIAQAATTTTTFAVTATVQSTCSATAATLAFPNYTPGGGAQTGNTTISVKCTKNTPFTTAALSSIFGDGTGGTQTIAGTGLGVATANSVQVFGQVPDSATNQAA